MFFKKKELPTTLELVKVAWAYYTANFKNLMKLMLVTIPVMALFLLGIAGCVGFVALISMAATSALSMMTVWALGLTVLALSVGAIAFAIVTGLKLQTALVWVALKKDTKKSFMELWEIGSEKYNDYFNTTILAALMILGWFLLLIIPGFIMAVNYMFAGWIYLDKGKKGKEAIAESKELVKGRWWPIVGRVLLLQILYYLVISVVSALCGAKFGNTQDHIYGIVNNIFSFFLAPFFISYAAGLYQALKKSK